LQRTQARGEIRLLRPFYFPQKGGANEMDWRLKKAIVYISGLLLMGLSIWLYVLFMHKYETAIVLMETLKPARMLQPGDVIREDLVRRVTIPVAAHDLEATVNVDELIGKTVLVPIGTSEEFLAWKVGDRMLAPRNDERYFSFKSDKIQNDGNIVRRGDRVDVWVEFDMPRLLRDTSGSRRQIAGLKLIEGLLVASVKTNDGVEVSDMEGLNLVLTKVGNPTSTSRISPTQARSTPNGIPDINTYVMREDIYHAYLLGNLGGKIKLALPDWNQMSRVTAEASLTEMFLLLKDSDLFSKDPKRQEVLVDRIIPDQLTGKRGE
jgi:hypothetical protein